MSEFITVTTQALGGGAATGLVAWGAYVLWKFWGNRESHRATERRASAQNLDEGFSRLLAASERQDAEMARQDAKITALSDQAIEDRKRIGKLEDSNRELAEENRTFRELLGALIEGLRRKPPDDPHTMLELIFARVPFLRDVHHKE